MKKLISVLGATALVGSSAMSVVACGHDAWWTEFNKAVQNQETFLVYIGAQDCDYCNQFEEAHAATGDLLDTKLKQMITTYEANIASITNVEVDNNTGWGQTIKKPASVSLKEFIIEAKADNFTEKWSKNILEWLRDQLREIYFKTQFSAVIANGNVSEVTARNMTNSAVKNYIDKSKGTPFFIMVRNGLFAGVTAGYEQSAGKNYTEDLRVWFDTINDFFQADDLGKQMTDLINSTSTGDGTDTGDTSTTESALTSYDYSQINLEKYL